MFARRYYSLRVAGTAACSPNSEHAKCRSQPALTQMRQLNCWADCAAGADATNDAEGVSGNWRWGWCWCTEIL